MIATKNLNEDILEQLKTKSLVRIPASEKDYFSIVYKIPFKVEYHDSEIITMGLSTPWHEIIVMNMGRILNNLFLENEEMLILGSNSGVQIPKFEGGYYMPDVLVLKNEPIFKQNSTAIITNPHIVIEVLSPATADFDSTEKLPEYKRIESLKQIIFISQKKMNVSVYSRQGTSNIWLNQDFDQETDEIMIDNLPVFVKDIYRKIKFIK